MIDDRVRTKSYIDALRTLVNDNSVVLDIGTGIGIFGLVSARLGAQKVYAVEPNIAIQLARELTLENNCEDKIELLHGLSTEISLPEQVDLIVSDLRGALPLAGKTLLSIIDARERFLKPGGTLIPAIDKLFAAIVEAPELNVDLEHNDNDYLGLSFNATDKYTTNVWRRGRVQPGQLLTTPKEWATIDYRKLNSPDFNGELSWSTSRQGTGNGFVLWFDTVLTDGIGFSNKPGDGPKVYGNAFFPWPESVELDEAAHIRLNLNATLVNDDYMWSWETRIFDRDHESAPKSHFRQSTFFSELFSPAALKKSAAEYVATLSDEDQIDKFVLNCIDGSTTHAQIAERLLQTHPKSFSGLRDALTRVAAVANRYATPF